MLLIGIANRCSGEQGRLGGPRQADLCGGRHGLGLTEPALLQV